MRVRERRSGMGEGSWAERRDGPWVGCRRAHGGRAWSDGAEWATEHLEGGKVGRRELGRQQAKAGCRHGKRKRKTRPVLDLG